ncbi:uncharacterized protein CTRU02_207553 [Colletotrichum truncatum]|uniref:Uncharacterized protein n=11 Tax=Colletotrichum truncatum TaxID=5467 RepID=A0ACC3ZBR7_COLTU|nr:uncharacterized protein CTRU02_14465 [Colletotrichum truncatum]XP_036575797.1 uncharacterized protein CTRU02_14205 [Colletotrichum truncatum]XP_036576925.1 uncharacterized protein CTRU02_13029 [Colletotrichum truncatum]XP_036577801.1 uncharacterized protein CTRU02_12319 [Colletotrichum truncatum]XP_036578295.1 uncharacterized protein CTRU02_11796 [Colletotrichum truncatum]XP_036578682.1 uncharacterized protein CTRU02_11273 [Colletotrichum truncatum]XP_036580765.1 uncharacterized protein CT
MPPRRARAPSIDNTTGPAKRKRLKTAKALETNTTTGSPSRVVIVRTRARARAQASEPAKTPVKPPRRRRVVVIPSPAQRVAQLAETETGITQQNLEVDEVEETQPAGHYEHQAIGQSTPGQRLQYNLNLDEDPFAVTPARPGRRPLPDTPTPRRTQPQSINLTVTYTPLFSGGRSPPKLPETIYKWIFDEESEVGHKLIIQWSKIERDLAKRIDARLRAQYNIEKSWITTKIAWRRIGLKAVTIVYREEFAVDSGNWPVVPWYDISKQIIENSRLGEVLLDVELAYSVTPTVAAVGELEGVGSPRGRPSRLSQRQTVTNTMLQAIETEGDRKRKLFRDLLRHNQCNDSATCQNTSSADPTVNWCWVNARKHYKLTVFDFEKWQEAIQKGEEGVSISNPPARLIVDLVQREQRDMKKPDKSANRGGQNSLGEKSANRGLSDTQDPANTANNNSAVVNFYGLPPPGGPTQYWPKLPPPTMPPQYWDLEPQFQPQSGDYSARRQVEAPIRSSSPVVPDSPSKATRQVDEFVSWFLAVNGKKLGIDEVKFTPLKASIVSLRVIRDYPDSWFKEVGFSPQLTAAVRKSIKLFTTTQQFYLQQSEPLAAVQSLVQATKKPAVDREVEDEVYNRLFDERFGETGNIERSASKVGEISVPAGRISSPLPTGDIEFGRGELDLFVSSPPPPILPPNTEQNPIEVSDYISSPYTQEEEEVKLG